LPALRAQARQAWPIVLGYNKCMEEYFDKDFFRFLAGFLFLLLISGAVVLAARIYEKGNLAGTGAPCVGEGC